ncbi:MAG: sensor histidine kinase [Myxococcales bacterium]
MAEKAEAAPDVPILVVDDRPQNRAALRAILSSPDYSIVEAASGPEALRLLLDGEFALILVDVRMPGMTGFEFAEVVKARPRTAGTPIVFVTAEAQNRGFAEQSYRLDAADFLVKPLEPAVVAAKVAVFAQLYRQRRELTRQAGLLAEAQSQEAELRLADLRLAGERRYHVLADAIPHIVWVARPDGALDYLNRRWFEFAGAPPVGGWAERIHPEDQARYDEAWEGARRSIQPFQLELRLRNSGGAWRWQLARAVPERNTAGSVTAWLGTFTDIEDRKRAEAERELQYQRALVAIRARDDFLSIASHELRTPLSALKLNLDLLLRNERRSGRTELSEEAVKRLLAANRQIDRLNRLISDLLDVARITSGTLTLQLEDLDLAQVAREAVARLDDEAARAGSAVMVRSQPVSGRWDRSRLEQVVTNLVANAIKFGGGRPVEVSIAPAGQRALLSVEDHGVGIAPEDQERIFERFERAVPPRAYGGLGLGLYIVRQIVAAHGGQVSLASRLGEGTKITVDLPRESAGAQAARAQGPPSPFPVRSLE